MQSTTNQLKPAILETFGDIAQAIGERFDTYLNVVGQVLKQASLVTTSSDVNVEMYDYVISLREGIMDAWGGILLAYKGKPQGRSILPGCLHLLIRSSTKLGRIHPAYFRAPSQHCSRFFLP